MLSKISLISMSLVIILISLFLISLRPVNSISKQQLIEIAPKSGFKEIAGLLHDNKIIRSPLAFMIYGVFSGSAHQLKPGNYILNTGSSTPAIIDIIARGPSVDKEIILPEGATLNDMNVILEKSGILPQKNILNFPQKELAAKYEFLKGIKNLEGFLFPDTYRFFINSKSDNISKKMLDNFENKAWPLLKGCLVSTPTGRQAMPTGRQAMPTGRQASIDCQKLDYYQLITVASLLEKEAPDFNDRRIIAGVLFKRLKTDMPLQVDATIVYVKCNRKFLTCENTKILKKDLVFQSPYNTYLHYGLPPGPIGNPGLEAIKAALNPVNSDYWYYLSDPKTKKTIFSKTLKEHNENRARYLNI